MRLSSWFSVKGHQPASQLCHALLPFDCKLWITLMRPLFSAVFVLHGSTSCWNRFMSKTAFICAMFVSHHCPLALNESLITAFPTCFCISFFFSQLFATLQSLCCILFACRKLLIMHAYHWFSSTCKQKIMCWVRIMCKLCFSWGCKHLSQRSYTTCIVLSGMH